MQFYYQILQEESELAAKDEQLDDGGDEEQGDESEFNPNER